MFRYLSYLILLIFSFFCQSQNSTIDDELADSYFRRGNFKKALVLYKNAYDNSTYKTKYLYKLVATYRQLEQYSNAETLILEGLKKYYNPSLIVELGYNFQLKDSLSAAKELYNEAISFLDENPNYVYAIGKSFEEYSLLEEAIKTYKKAKTLLPNKNFTVQMAKIYGDMGDIENMFANYFDYIDHQPQYLDNIKRALSEFISEDNKSKNNTYLKRLLLIKIQRNPSSYWYQLLSWLYVQERSYTKSFVQEKALYKRNPESLDRIIDLAITAMEDQNTDTAKTIFQFVSETSQDEDTLLLAQQKILEIRTKDADSLQLNQIKQDYKNILNTYGMTTRTIPLQLSFGQFLAFSKKDTQEASTFLKQSLKIKASKFQLAKVKLLLADILVIEEKFNEALILFSQIQANLKNSNIAQEARFKVAKTSFYKGDFDWAESQLKVLKSSTSQLIANDALDLKLLISDNKDIDSLQTALKHYAKADLLAFQNKTDNAITLLDSILVNFKGESITDEALFKQAKLYEIKEEYLKAEANYLQIISDYNFDILVDDALFNLAELYNKYLKNFEEAKRYYENIVFNHQDSIYFVEARKKFRQLRGDEVN